MSRLIVVLLFVFASFQAFSEEVRDSKPAGYQITLEDSQGRIQEQLDVPAIPAGMSKGDYLKNFYQTLSVDSYTDLTTALGYEPVRGLQFEVYVGLNTLNLIAGRVVLPYGARVRVIPFSFDNGRKVFVEYDRREYFYGLTDEWGHLTDVRLTSLGVTSPTGKYSIKLGTGTDTHHRWEDETHGPEKNRTYKIGWTMKLGRKRP